MVRGLPFSILFHLAVLALMIAWGSYVPPAPLEPQRVLRVQIARLPAAPQISQATPEPEPEATPPETQPIAAPRPKPPEPVLPPKEVPKRSEPAAQPVKPPEPVQAPARPQPRDQSPPPDADATATLTAGGPAVSGTDVDFPFAWYLNRVEGIIARQWNPRQLGFRESATRTCVVHFMIDRAGQISQATLVRSSGVALFDREALRAVRSGRLPPLPPKFPHRALGVTFVFTLESGI